MTPPLVWVGLTREQAEAIIDTIEAEAFPGVDRDGMRDAIRATLSRKEQPWVGCEYKAPDGNYVLPGPMPSKRQALQPVRRVLVVPLGEGES